MFVKKEDDKMKNKAMTLGLGFLLMVGVVSAIYMVNSFTVKSDVYEPFEISYSIIGDAGNYDGVSTCAGLDSTAYMDYSTLNQPVDMDGLYAGESRKFCVRINNLGEGDIPYVITSKVKTGLGNYNECVASFPEVIKEGTAQGSVVTFDGSVLNVPTDASPVNDCEIEISVSRA